MLATIAVAACSNGSNSHSSTEHIAFVQAVGRVCERAVAAHAGHDFPVSNFDPQHPNPDRLPAVGDYFAHYGRLPQIVTDFHHLAPPAEDAAAWRRLLEVADEMRTNALRQIAAADAKDIKTFVATVRTASRLTDQLNGDGQRFGFTANSPCNQVFG